MQTGRAAFAQIRKLFWPPRLRLRIFCNPFLRPFAFDVIGNTTTKPEGEMAWEGEGPGRHPAEPERAGTGPSGTAHGSAGASPSQSTLSRFP